MRVFTLALSGVMLVMLSGILLPVQAGDGTPTRDNNISAEHTQKPGTYTTPGSSTGNDQNKTGNGGHTNGIFPKEAPAPDNSYPQIQARDPITTRDQITQTDQIAPREPLAPRDPY